MRQPTLARTGLTLAALATLLLAPAARAISTEVKGWTLSLSGAADGYLTMAFCDTSASPGVAGGIACQVGPGGETRAAIESGLLPGFLNLEVKTQSGDIEYGADMGFFSGLSSTDGGKRGFAATTMDLRKNYLFFGTKGLGTIKVGRDMAIFGSDAILNDMSLTGAGSGVAFPVGFGQTTFGRIGVGYIYVDWAPQIAYTSPDLSGAKVTVALLQAWDTLNFSGTTTPSLQGHKTPGVQGKLTYDLAGSVPAHLWAGGWWQTAASLGGTNPVPVGKSITTTAFEVGATVTPVSGLQLMGYFYAGNGAGTTGVVFDAASWDGTTLATRKSMGYIAQATYTIHSVKLGLSYGQSTLDVASNEAAAGNPLVKSNSSIIGGLYYTLVPGLTLTAEATGTTAKSHAGSSISDTSVALGSIIFF
jgi:hypothetical protein